MPVGKVLFQVAVPVLSRDEMAVIADCVPVVFPVFVGSPDTGFAVNRTLPVGVLTPTPATTVVNAILVPLVTDADDGLSETIGVALLIISL